MHIKKNEFDEDISWTRELFKFHGTVAYHSLSLFRSVLTDGAKFLADNADCYWMFEAIDAFLMEHAKVKGICFDNRFVVTTIEVNQDVYSAALIMKNGNYKILNQVDIEFTNFPLPQFEVWAQYWNRINSWVHMLPSEY